MGTVGTPPSQPPLTMTQNLFKVVLTWTEFPKKIFLKRQIDFSTILPKKLILLFDGT
jgi:hypothetical protein